MSIIDFIRKWDDSILEKLDIILGKTRTENTISAYEENGKWYLVQKTEKVLVSGDEETIFNKLNDMVAEYGLDKPL